MKNRMLRRRIAVLVLALIGPALSFGAVALPEEDPESIIDPQDLVDENTAVIVVGESSAGSEDEAESLEADEDLFDLSLEELMEMPVGVSGALTETSRRLNPATVTTLTQEDIRRSGARDLDELLDIYVPNYQRLHEYYEFRKAGLRGINSDRDDKYLILVNGKVMNEHTHYGAISERDLPTLTDIHHVDVIRGPGSALYGPGAIAMVINIVTESSKTFEGTEVTARMGAVEEFYSGEVKHGGRIDEDSGYFLFAGVTKYLGADLGDTPLEYGRPDWGVELSQPRLHQAWRNQPKFKLHAQFDHGDFETWIRYTKGGEYRAKLPWFPEEYRKQGDGYQQLTWLAKYEYEVTEALSLEFTAAFDVFDYEKSVFDTVFSHREDEYSARLLARWNLAEGHELAFGGEYAYEKFGKESPGWPHEEAMDWTFAIYGFDELPHWSTRMYSLLAEYQGRLSEDWTVFLGGRADHHTFTRDMYSPRASLIYTPTEKDTAKLIYSRSVKTGVAADMKVTDILSNRDTTPEKIDALELRYERQQTDRLWLGASGFYHYHDLLSYDFSKGYTDILGNLETWGIELEALYKLKDTRIILSHGYTKLIDWDPEDGVQDVVSVEPLGYGNDLAQWCDHITKLTVGHDLSDTVSVDGSVRAYWGYPGFQDYTRYTEDYYAPLVPGANHKHFGPTFFTNLGFEYRPMDGMIMRLDGHDLLGFFDHDNNQRLYGYYMEGDTRSLAPSVTLSVTYRF